ncbi:MAG: hypothetical protein HQL06_07160 [Nitrospirae bacterium]|nr:hypothetical protein [Nitrospirota bacterium]
MSWLEYHKKSEEFAAEAEVLVRQGQMERASELYCKAAEAEELAVNSLEPGKNRTLGISVVSAVSLWYKAAQYEKAKQFAYRWLSEPSLIAFAKEDLEILLQTIRDNEVRDKAGVKLSDENVLVSATGGEIVRGGAPLNTIVNMIKQIESLYFRITEYLINLPFRKRGSVNTEVMKICRPWLLQTSPGSYQFVVALREPIQGELFPRNTPKSAQIISTFMKILRSTINDPDTMLPSIVEDIAYRRTFLNMVRNLAPTGKIFDQMVIKSSLEIEPVTISAIARQTIKESMDRQFPVKTSYQEVSLCGILRAVHLDDDWLGIVVDGKLIKITEVSETVDDVVGPMVNRDVIVRAIKKSDTDYNLIDIQTKE